MPAQAFEQLRLCYRLAAGSAEIYHQAGFTVVYQDVIIGPLLGEVVEMLKHLPLHVVVLCPSPQVAAQRDATRHKIAYGLWTPQALDHELRTNAPRVGLWLDTSSLTVEETVHIIFAQIEQTTDGIR
jgi:hypothetical protein